jgi:hypothetical protein
MLLLTAKVVLHKLLFPLFVRFDVGAVDSSCYVRAFGLAFIYLFELKVIISRLRR